jgi:hypothetical protein
MSEKELEAFTYMPRQLGTVTDEDLPDFHVCLDLFINRALDLNRKEKDVRVAVDRIIYMLRHKYEHVGLKFTILSKNTAFGQAIFLIESGDKVAIDVLVDRVGFSDKVD